MGLSKNTTASALAKLKKTVKSGGWVVHTDGATVLSVEPSGFLKFALATGQKLTLNPYGNTLHYA